MDSQETIRIKAKEHADVRKQEALNLLAISRREAERKKSLSICREEIRRRESKTVVDLLNLTDSEEAQRKTRERAHRRASSAVEMIAASTAAARRPIKRSGSELRAAGQALDEAAGRNVPAIPPFRGTKLSNSIPGFLNLPIKHNARSLAHACGFPSLSLFS